MNSSNYCIKGSKRRTSLDPEYLFQLLEKQQDSTREQTMNHSYPVQLRK